MRRHVIETLGNDVGVTDLSEDDLVDADEVFISNSQIGVVPVHRCGSHKWAVGNTTRDVMALLARSGIDECRL
jgi:4-amino-4-deoxychorismate lyase